jgi:hypothetical protein
MLSRKSRMSLVTAAPLQFRNFVDFALPALANRRFRPLSHLSNLASKQLFEAV